MASKMRYCGTRADGSPIYTLLTPEENRAKVDKIHHDIIAPAIVNAYERGEADAGEWTMAHIDRCSDCKATREKLFLNSD